MTVTNIIFEIPTDELAAIAKSVTSAASTVCAVVNISQEDCIKSWLHQKGIYSWLSCYVQGEYALCSMTNNTITFYDNPIPSSSKPWHVSTGGTSSGLFRCRFSETIPIVIRFSENSDAILFKITFVDKSA